MNVSLHMISDSPPASPEQSSTSLVDSHGRTIKDLRLSVTDRCNFRCIYCMEPDVKYLAKMDLLSLEDYVRVVQVAMSLGIDKLRITGGEPTLYPHLDDFIERVGALGLRDVALTTNGSRLTREMCDRWKQMGLNRITVSLDTLRPNRKDAITRSFTPLDTVIRAIDMARDAGLTPVKVNAVVMRGVNEDELQEFADFAIEHGVDMRLIEFMALDAGRNWSMDDVVPASEMIEVISRKHTLVKENDSPSSTSMNYKFAEGTSAGGRIGFIASVTNSFCLGCDRIRMMADGTVRPCLFSDDEWSIRTLLRDGADDQSLQQFFRDAALAKSAGHGMGREDFVRPEKTMSTIGG